MAIDPLDNLEALLLPKVRKSFLDSIQTVVDDVILSDLTKAIEEQDLNKIIKIINLNEQALYPFLKQMEDVFEQGALTVSSSFPKILTNSEGINTVFRFNMRDPVVEAFLAQESSKLVSKITDEARVNIMTVLSRGVARGDNPRTTALDIVGRIDPATKKRVGGVIGLTQQQELWVSNVERDLLTQDKNYFKRKLRDKRFDSIVKKSFESGKPLSKENITKLVTASKNKTLKLRGDIISRTETIQTLNKSDYQAHLQLINEGLVKKENLKREWDHVGDLRTRPSHMIMGQKYGKGKGVAIDEPFILPDGKKLMYPGDTSLGADADDTIGCRCKVRTRIKFRSSV